MIKGKRWCSELEKRLLYIKGTLLSTLPLGRLALATNHHVCHCLLWM